MHATLAFVYCQPDFFPGAVLMALALTAAISIPLGFFVGSIREKMAATTSKKTP